MSLRRRFVTYLATVHLLFAGLAFLLLKQNRLWLLAIEAAFGLSLALGVGLVQRLFRSLAIVRESATYLKEHDYTTRIRATGQADVDALIDVYNKMVDSLRDERLRLQEQQHLLSTILEVSPSGFVTLDFDGRVDYLNPSALELLPSHGALARGSTLAEIGSPLAVALDALRPGQTRVVSLGAGRRLKCYRGASLDRGFPRSFILIEELTEELRLYEQAAYEKLIRMLSHEVNNSVGASNSLLHSCLNYAQHLPAGDRQDFVSALQVAIARTEQLSKFMKGFADVVRLPAPSLQQCDVHKLLEDVVRLMRPAAERSGVTLEHDLGPPGATALLDRGQMEQVLLNVLKNAIEAAGQGGRVTLRLGRQGARPLVVVEDTGPGIDAVTRANLFTPFFTTKPLGQGIGLTVVQEILHQHRFEFSLDAAPGGPTRFTIGL